MRKDIKKPNLTNFWAKGSFASMLLTASSPKEFISLMRGNYRRKGKKISLQQWSQRLGYKSPRSLGMLLEGRRLPSVEMIELLSSDFGLTEKEKRYFHLLVLSKKENKPELKREIAKEINSIQKLADRPIHQLSLEEFVKLYRWYVFVIRQLVGTKNFKEDFQWIKKRLRNKVSIDHIQEAISNLLAVGGLERDKRTKKLVKVEKNFLSRDDVPNSAIRQHHTEMLERAKEAIHEQGVSEREMHSWVFTMNKADLPALKQHLKNFRFAIDAEYSKVEGDSVFQFSMQLFEHTLDIEDKNEKN